MSMGRKPIEPRIRFWQKVDKSGDCWLWTAYVHRTGYGMFGIATRNSVYAHRFAYEDTVGPIPDGMVIDHRCLQKACVRPDHLRVVTPKQNEENHHRAQSNSLSGVRNVRLNKQTGRYRVTVTHHGRAHFRGEFNTIEEAAEAAKQLRLSLFSHNDADRKSA